VDDLLWRRVAAFVADEVGVPRGQVRWGTTLFGDLGVDGMDAEELMERFAAEFHVDLSEYDHRRHFRPKAGTNPVTALQMLVTRLLGLMPEQAAGLRPLTVGNLAAAASAGRWMPPRRTTAPDFVEEAGYRVLEDLAVPPAEARRHEASMLELLWDEDITMGFIPDVQELLGIDVPPDDWERVQTVGEVIEMLRKHADAQRNDAETRSEP
jgi:acyl carrier protein